MKTADFIRKHGTRYEGAEWALLFPDEMSAVWDELVKQRNYKRLLWTATRPGVFSESVLRKLACRFIRETPLHDGRTVWDLLEDDRSRNAIEVAEAYVDGNATKKELVAAAAAASDAAAAYVDDIACAACYAACAASNVAADAAAHTAACYAGACAAAYAAASYADADADADYYAACAAKLAQIKMIAELGNPFKER